MSIRNYRLLHRYFQKAGLCVIQDELLSRHTTFRIGGPVDFFVSPKTIKELVHIVYELWRTEAPFKIIGNGSNILAGDHGFRGVIINTRRLNEYRLSPNGLIEAQAGTSLRLLSLLAAKNGFSGLEFATGIPATIGGAVVMNAGAGQSDLGKIVYGVQVLNPLTGCKWLGNKKCGFGYRTSIFRRPDQVILRVALKLRPGHSPTKVVENTLSQLRSKELRQPLNASCGGCTFLNPPGASSGELIEKAGLKSFSYCGVTVSPIHAGFIINRANGSASEVVSLIDHVRSTIFKTFGITLALEIEEIGD